MFFRRRIDWVLGDGKWGRGSLKKKSSAWFYVYFYEYLFSEICRIATKRNFLESETFFMWKEELWQACEIIWHQNKAKKHFFNIFLCLRTRLCKGILFLHFKCHILCVFHFMCRMNCSRNVAPFYILITSEYSIAKTCRVLHNSTKEHPCWNSQMWKTIGL